MGQVFCKIIWYNKKGVMEMKKNRLFLIIAALAIVVVCIVIIKLPLDNKTNMIEKESTNNKLTEILSPIKEEYVCSAIVIDAKTGKILANYGDIDKPYEPSSTFKPFITTILLEKGDLSLSDMFEGNQYTDANGVTIRSYNNQVGEKTFFEHFVSMNEPVIIRAWEKNGVNLNLQNELSDLFKWSDLSLDPNYKSEHLLGKEFNVTVSDMAQSYIYLTTDMDDTHGKEISKNTKESMRNLIHESYLNYAYIEPDLMPLQTIGEVAGMYGSSYHEKDGKNYETSSFVGFAPYDNPEIIFAISMEKIIAEDEYTDYKIPLAAISTEVFNQYLSTRYFNEIADNEQLENLNKESEYFIYFGRPTCVPCKRVEPILRNIANSLEKRVFYFNTDRFRDSILDDMLTKYDIDLVPCIIKVVDGKTVEKEFFVGDIDLDAHIEKILKS